MATEKLSWPPSSGSFRTAFLLLPAADALLQRSKPPSPPPPPRSLLPWAYEERSAASSYPKADEHRNLLLQRRGLPLGQANPLPHSGGKTAAPYHHRLFKMAVISASSNSPVSVPPFLPINLPQVTPSPRRIFFYWTVAKRSVFYWFQGVVDHTETDSLLGNKEIKAGVTASFNPISVFRWVTPASYRHALATTVCHFERLSDGPTTKSHSV